LVLPDGCVDILFSAQHGVPLDLSVVGLMTAQQTFDVPAGQSFFGIRFRPGMASAFLEGITQLNNKVESLENIIGPAGRRLFHQLGELSSFEEMARVMDGFLRPLEPPDVGQKAVELLAMRDLSIDRVASEAGLSVRQLRRVSQQRAGVSPKYLSRILRFRSAAKQIAVTPDRSTPPNWVRLAADAGYFDQAHFIREFQQFAGCTPGRYLQSLRRGSS
jgi:AraC-like DNA-binding protein